MSHKDAEREREIEGSGDVAALKRLQSSRKGQITNLEQNVAKYTGTTIAGMKKASIESTLTTLENQFYCYELIQDRILTLLQESRDDPEHAIYQGREVLEDEEATGDAELETAKALRLKLQEYVHAIDTHHKVRSVKRKLRALTESDRMGDCDMDAQLSGIGKTVDELLLTEGELSHVDDISTQIQDLHMSYQAFTRDVLKARPTPVIPHGHPTPADPKSMYDQRLKLPQTEMPTFDGDPRQWRSVWERFSQ